MKKTLLTLLATAFIFFNAQTANRPVKEPVDTLTTTSKSITKTFAEESATTTGKKRVTYYVIVNDKIYKVTKSDFETLKLYQKHGLTAEIGIISAKKKVIIL